MTIIIKVYCGMEQECGGLKGGWLKVNSFSANSGGDGSTEYYWQSTNNSKGLSFKFQAGFIDTSVAIYL